MAMPSWTGSRTTMHGSNRIRYSRVRTPGQVRAALPSNAPLKGESFAAILGDIEKLILPGITHWQSPNF